MAWHGLPLPRRSRRWQETDLQRLRRSQRIESGSDSGATLVLAEQLVRAAWQLLCLFRWRTLWGDRDALSPRAQNPAFDAHCS
ncbi:GM10715 [Drosophila sechellia]|uniref:GM10715 n=1 Tax=Drosophila sechellia TaxID=7238 RepID=B4I3L5_DROSE|nr:GM10715 [Drosophila sechellia]